MRRKLSDLIRGFLRWAAHVHKPVTVAVYRHYFRGFLAHVGNRRLSSLKPRHLQEWAKTWHQAQAIKRLFSWAVNDDRSIKESPFARVKQPPRAERRRIFTRREQLTMLRRTRPDLRRLLVAMRETMARPGELRAATWEDLRPNESTADLTRALRAGQATLVLHEYKSRKSRLRPNTPRVILISPRAGRLLARLLDGTEIAAGPIFRTRLNRAWSANALRCRFRRLRVQLNTQRDKHGETIVPYTFRHTAATLCSAEGIRDRTLADLLGHTETSTTARYQHLAVEHLRAAMQKIWFRRPRLTPARRRPGRRRPR